MMPQFVAERCPQCPDHFQVQEQSVAVIRAEQKDLPVGLPAQMSILRFWPENQVNTMQREVDNAMQLQMCHQIFMLGNLFQAATGAHALLISENKELRQHILQRTEALEKEWLGVAEVFSARVDALYRNIKKFHQELHAGYQEALNTYEICKKIPSHAPDGSFGFKMGEALAKHSFYSVYAESDYGVGKHHLPAIEKLLPTLRDTLKANVKAEIQKINKEMPQELSGHLQQAAPFNLNDIATNADHPIQAFVQKSQKEIQSQEDLNHLVRNENASLEKMKLELANVDSKFLNIFRNYLSPCFALRSSINYIDVTTASYVRSYTTTYNKLDQWHKANWTSGGECTQGILLRDKISAHLNEVKALVKALEKKDSP